MVWKGIGQSSLPDFPKIQIPYTAASPSPAVLGTTQSTPSAQLAEELVQVTKVVDGDTIEVSINNELKKIRLIGINTPETVDPRRAVQCFGKEASNETKRLLEAQKVILTKDVSETDKYERLLRLVYLPLPDGQLLFVNDYLVRQGYANVYTYPPDVKFDEQFKKAEKEAKEAKRGLWGKCF